MKDNETIQTLKTLLCLINNSESFYIEISAGILESTLAIINRQKADNERLNRCNWHISNDLREEINKNIRLQAEIEELLAELERFKKIETTVNAFWSELQKITTFKKKRKPTLEELLEYMENLKAEAIKEYIEKLKSKAYLENGVTGFQEMVVDVRDIDETYEEMVGDTE